MTPLTVCQHDGAAAILLNGQTTYCGEEERYLRYKHARGHIPVNAIAKSLEFNKIGIKDIKAVFISACKYPDLKKRVQVYFKHYFGHSPEVIMVDHQLSHLASAYFPSNFNKSMILSIDGMGDFKSMAGGVGSNGKIKILQTKSVDQSLGIFYQTMTQFIGFDGMGDEYKVMGLSAYGKKHLDLSKIIKVKEFDYKIDPSFLKREPIHRNFDEPRYGEKLIGLFGKPRIKGEKINQFHKDFALSVQTNFEKAVIALVKNLHKKTGLRNLCLAGGCALNCVTNMKLLELDFIDNLYVQPAATDQGSALGAALYGSNSYGIKPKIIKNYYLGEGFSNSEILKVLKICNVKFSKIKNISNYVAKSLNKGKIVAIFNGRSEFGPRALGNRSILANPKIKNIKDEINKKIKFRESFRPFAPAVLEDKSNEIFYMKNKSPHMTITYKVKPKWIKKIPGVVHIDKTARVQTVNSSDNKQFYSIIKNFYKLSKVPVVVNTSFNIKGEPMVDKPLDAIKTFFSSGIDELYLGNFLITKQKK